MPDAPPDTPAAPLPTATRMLVALRAYHWNGSVELGDRDLDALATWLATWLAREMSPASKP